MIQLPELYSKHLKKQFNYPQYLILSILINLLQNLHTVRLEELARRFPIPIQLRSRVKKIQRFLSLTQFEVQTLWFPSLESWIKTKWQPSKAIYLALDRSQWRAINLLMVSLIYERRAIPVYFFLLPKKGNSNLVQQKQVLEPALKLFRDYKIIVLGDREFCGVELARWLSQQEKVYLSLRLKKNEFVELESQIWFQLSDLGLEPGMSCYYQGIKVTKSKGFSGFNLAAKYKRNYKNKSAKEPWYILTNLDNLSAATDAYAKRMGIEEMFRDLKLGGYNLEITQVSDRRLISTIILITLAYFISILSGQFIKQKGLAKYVTRPTEQERFYKRHSSFSIGLHGQNWIESNTFFQDVIQELIHFSTAKYDYYRKGIRAKTLIQQAF
ncbi:MAG: IS4 family transposase [Pleurocapsa sp.]